MLGNNLILRVFTLSCIFLGGIFAIIATAGKEWQIFESHVSYRVGYSSYRNVTVTNKFGLWEYCTDDTYFGYRSRPNCKPVNNKLNSIKGNLKGNYFFI